jgi:hypothetical protein
MSIQLRQNLEATIDQQFHRPRIKVMPQQTSKIMKAMEKQ